MDGGPNKRGIRWRWRLSALAAVLLMVVVSAEAAQFGQRRGRGRGGGRGPRLGSLAQGSPLWDRYVTFDDFDGSFQFCRLQFRNATDGDGDGWSVDWPRADQNLSIRLSELTRTPVSMDATDTPN